MVYNRGGLPITKWDGRVRNVARRLSGWAQTSGDNVDGLREIDSRDMGIVRSSEQSGG
jgi:hypothetical protein